MPINKALKYSFMGFSVFFQIYLAYAATLYLEVLSFSFGFVSITALCSITVLVYYISVGYEKKNKFNHISGFPQINLCKIQH
jgi:hypothetical protein